MDRISEEGRAKKSGDNFTVKESKIVGFMGIFMIAAGILLLVLELLFHVEAIPLWVYPVVLAIILGGTALCMGEKNRRLEVDGEKMCYVNFLGRKKEFSLLDIGYVRAASDASKGEDYIRLYDKTGKRLCRLESSMSHSLLLIGFLHENGIKIDTPAESGNLFSDVVMQERIPEESVRKTAEAAYGETEAALAAWREKNRRTGAEFYFGLAQYHGRRIDPEAEIQPEESRYFPKEGEKLPDDYLCVMEIYVKKDGYFVRDRRNDLLLMTFPLICKREPLRDSLWNAYHAASLEARTENDGKVRTAEVETAVYYNKNYSRELSEALAALERFLPGHRFVQERLQPGYELKRTVP